MGTLPIDTQTKTDAQGQRWTFDAWTTTDALARPEYGTVSVTITPQGQSEPTHSLFVCAADWSNGWHRRFRRVFLDQPDFRDTFLIVHVPPGPRHPTVSVTLPSGPAAIDTNLASAIISLNQAGAITQFCCQGGLGETGYITLKAGAFPPALTQAWTSAGFDMFGSTIYASAPVGLENEASQHWLQSLRDWMDNTLDLTGQRYQVTTPRPSSLPLLPTDSPSKIVRQDIQRLIRKGAHAKFRNYVDLHSGRDEYSRLTYDVLIERLAETDTTPIIASDLSQADQASACRWVLRGLPVDMALYKLQVDRKIRTNTRRRD